MDNAPADNIHPITEAPAAAPAPLALIKRGLAQSLEQVREIAGFLQDLDTVANALCKATILPTTLQAPANMKLALLQGMSMGFDVVQTIRASFVITSKKGGARVGYYVEALVALVRSSPVCRFFRVEEASAKRCRVTCARKDEPESVVHTFELTMDQAIEANLNAEWDMVDGKWVKSEKYTWKTAPADMLRNRTCGRAVKSVFQDVVYGMATPDELDDLNAAEAMQSTAAAGQLFSAIPVTQSPPRAAASSPPPPSSAAASPATSNVRDERDVVVDAEIVDDPDEKQWSSGDPAWDQLAHEIAQLANDAGVLHKLPIELIGEWDVKLAAAKTKRDLNALAPWIGAANRRAAQSKACAELAAHFAKTFNERNAKIREEERAAKAAKPEGAS